MLSRLLFLMMKWMTSKTNLETEQTRYMNIPSLIYYWGHFLLDCQPGASTSQVNNNGCGAVFKYNTFMTTQYDLKR
jgi:hypothetical protein